MIARNTSLKLVYNTTDITKDLCARLKSWSYTDNLSGQSDDLQITLEDINHLFMGDWFPDRGAKLTATLVRKNWTAAKTTQEFTLGTFEIDEIVNKYPPSEVTIKALSVYQSTSLRGENKNKSWENTTLSVIANDIASADGYTLYYSVDNDPSYDRIEQTEEQDLPFLKKLCDDAGLALKVSSSKIAIFDEKDYEDADSVLTIDRKAYKYISFSGRASINNYYSKAKVTYRNPKKKSNVSYTYTPTSSDTDVDRTLVVRKRFKTLDEAERIAKKRLRKENSKAWEAQLTILEDTIIYASQTITLSNFGKYDGKWIATKVVHGQNGSGDVTQIDIRKCLEGY